MAGSAWFGSIKVAITWFYKEPFSPSKCFTLQYQSPKLSWRAIG